jgi:hypothetical protein
MKEKFDLAETDFKKDVMWETVRNSRPIEKTSFVETQSHNPPLEPPDCSNETDLPVGVPLVGTQR